MALEFAKAKYNIVLHGRKKSDEFYKTLEEINKCGVENKTIFADFSNKQDLSKFEEYINTLKLKIFINNVALHNDNDVSKQIEVSLTTPIILTYSISKTMVKNGGGIIININSMAGKVTKYEEAVYCASKFGLRGFSDSIKFELIKHNVKVMDLYPGAINTGMSSNRENRENLIDPDEFSKFVVSLVKTKSFVAHDIDFTRTKF